jgi:anti-anti-sigma factor
MRDAAAVIELRGDLDGAADAALTTAWETATAHGPRSVVLKFDDVGFINSTGIALIVAVLAQARKAKLPLLATGLSEHYAHIFAITRLADFMTLYPDEEAALAALA